MPRIGFGVHVHYQCITCGIGETSPVECLCDWGVTKNPSIIPALGSLFATVLCGTKIHPFVHVKRVTAITDSYRNARL